PTHDGGGQSARTGLRGKPVGQNGGIAAVPGDGAASVERSQQGAGVAGQGRSADRGEQERRRLAGPAPLVPAPQGGRDPPRSKTVRDVRLCRWRGGAGNGLATFWGVSPFFPTFPR